MEEFKLAKKYLMPICTISLVLEILNEIIIKINDTHEKNVIRKLFLHFNSLSFSFSNLSFKPINMGNNKRKQNDKKGKKNIPKNVNKRRRTISDSSSDGR